MSNRKVQVLLYTSYLHIIGGIETFVYNFIDLMSEYYDIGLYCPNLPPETAVMLSYKIPIFQTQELIECDNLIMIRIMDTIPPNIKYKKSIRMCHATKSNPTWHILKDCDVTVHVSKASKTSFNSDGVIIYNPLIKNENEALIFVSATRIPGKDKGQNANRMLRLAEMLNDAKIPFIWFNFSDEPLKNAPKGLVNIGAFRNLQPYIKRADYLVQLSDQEGFGYSVLEALINNVPVICTPFETTKELKVVDGKNAYIVPFDMNFDVKKLLKVPKFEYKWTNTAIVNKWKKLLGDTKPTRSYKHDDSLVKIRVIREYKDILLGKILKKGAILEMGRERAEYIQNIGYISIIED